MTTEEERQFYLDHGGTLVESPDKSADDIEIWDFGNVTEAVPDQFAKSLQQIPLFKSAHPELAGKGKGQVTLLYQAAEKVMGCQLDIGPQSWKDCVSWGVAGAIDLRACVEIETGEAEKYSWDDRVCTEVVQGLAAHEFNSGKGWTNSWYGSFAARDGGSLSRRRLGPYSGKRAKQWAKNGLPDELEPDAREHRTRDVSRIMNFDEATDALFGGFPIVIGSNQGFKNAGRRDEQGFATASKYQWKHCMKFVAARDDENPGLLCMNSWAPNKGPKGQFSDIPEGSFWVAPSTCNRMFEKGAGFALGGFEGYPSQ